MRSSADIMEIFSSVQGEGLLVGQRQLFVRFHGCNLSCEYCDTKASRGPVQDCRCEAAPGKGGFLAQPNPVDSDRLIECIQGLACQANLHDFAVLTGGEPLLHSRFLSEVLPRIVQIMPVLLETNGTLYEELAQVLPWVEVISMDVKVASATGQPTDWAAHRRFLNACRGKRVYVKAVLSPKVTQGEADRLTDLVAGADRSIPLVLQPVHGSQGDSSWIRRLLEIQGFCKQYLDSVLVIPQIHKILKIL